MKKPIKALLITSAILLSGALTVTGMYAYFTDNEDGINTFTIGDVHIIAEEPNFPTYDGDKDGVPDDCELITPYETITKDPYIQNTGTNDAIVFMKVTVPVEVVTLIDDNGNRGNEQEAALFWLKQKEDSDNTHQDHFDENWTRLTQLDGKFVNCEGINNEGRGYTYIFGYKTRIENREKTTALFDKVQNKKYGSGNIEADEIESIKIEAYAVQADNVLRSGIPVNTEGTISETDLTYIYNTFVNQNKDQLE